MQGGKAEYELYNIKSDPLQLKNLANVSRQNPIDAAAAISAALAPSDSRNVALSLPFQYNIKDIMLY